MKNLLVSSFLGFMLLYLLNGYFDKNFPIVQFIPKGKQIVLNPLDGILGEKKLDDGSIRPSNFDLILKIKASFLSDSSELYEVKKLKEGLFLVARKRFFDNNRGYSLFLKTEGDRIVFYHAINDLAIISALFSENKIYFIGDDRRGITNPSQSTYAVKINCVNLNFKEEWRTISKPNRSYFFFGTGLKIVDGKLSATIEVQGAGSSTMCVSSYNLILDKTGNLESQGASGGYGCGPGNEINLLELFEKTQ
nr:hypothetical protein [uncultured Fluviicola sp.]